MSNGNEFTEWAPNEFKINNFRTVRAFSYLLDKNGSWTSDSVLLYEQTVLFDSLKVYGRHCSNFSKKDKPEELEWNNFTTYFNPEGSVIHNILGPPDFDTSFYGENITIIKSWQDYKYEYNDSNKITREFYLEYDYEFRIRKKMGDTLELLSVDPKTIEYYYDQAGHLIQRFITDDQEHFLKTKSESESGGWGNYDPRYLNMEWIYNSDGLLEKEIVHTSKGVDYSRKYYFYDQNKRLIKEIDSTGWTYPVNPPNVDKIFTYQYLDSIKIKTETYNSKITDLYRVYEYDRKGNKLSDCNVYKAKETCTQYSYKYLNEKEIYYSYTDDDGYKYEVFYDYNLKGLLVEKKQYSNGILRNWVKYIYE